MVPAVLAGATAEVVAQEARSRGDLLEEVVVRAELLPTTWLEQTASSSIVSAETIASRAAVHLENLLLLTPNVNLAGGSSRARFYQIRGVGERSQFVEPLNASVGLLVDNIDFSGLGTAATLYDIEQVDVLRGPQGTLHGANALAGLISLRSADPTADFEGRINAGFGDYGRRELGAVLSGPLQQGTLEGRIAAFQHQSDGFIRNTFLGRSDTNERDETLVRGKLRWYPAARQQVDITLLHVDVDNGYDAFSLDNTRDTLSDEPGRDRQRSDALGLHWQREGDRIRSEFLASIADTDSEYSYDEDWSFVGIAPELEYSSFDQYLRQRDSMSAQLRFSSAEPISLGTRDLRWVAGAYWLEDDEDLRRVYTFASEDFSSAYRAQTAALFGQADLALSDQWRLSAGLRVANRDTRYSDSNDVDAAPDASLWGGRLALSYTSERWGNFYTALSRGYSADGVNAGILSYPRDGSENDSLLDQLNFYEEELLYNLELGHKAVFADGRVSSALTLFYMDRRDQQVRGSLVIPRDDGSTAFVDYTDNAGSSYNAGIEWELRARPTDRIDTYVNAGLLRARFEEYVNADGRDLSGREQAHAPSYQFAAGLTWHFEQGWSGTLEWEGRDGFFFSDRHDAQADSFQLLHARIAWEQPRWMIALWARNVLDEDYFTRGFGSFGNDPRKGYITEEYVQFADPRQLGASVELRF